MAEDARLKADLAAIGLVVTAIARTASRLVVTTRTARGTPLVAVVDRAANEHDVVFSRLMTKTALR